MDELNYYLIGAHIIKEGIKEEGIKEEIKKDIKDIKGTTKVDT